MSRASSTVRKNPFGNVVSNKFNEVQKYLTTTGHVYNASPFLVSKKFYDGLTDKEKEAVKKAAKEAQTFQRLENDKEDTVSAGTLQARGMKITALNPGRAAAGRCRAQAGL